MADRIRGITIEIGGDTTGLSRALSGVNSEIRGTQSQLRDVERLLKLDPSNTDLLRQRQRLLADAVGETRQKLDALKEAERQVQRQFEAGEISQEQYDALRREIIETEGRLRDLERQAGNSNAALQQIGMAGEKVEAFGRKVAGAGKALLPVTGAITAAGGAASKMAMDFEDAMAKVDTIADTTEVPLSELENAILDLSNQTGISSTEIANNVYDAISAGQKTGDAVNFVSNSTKLARAGFADAGSALDILTTIMNAYGLEASEVNRVSDVLIQTQNLGKTTVGELSSTMGKVIPTAKANGAALEQVAAGYAIMTANGVATAETTTYMNSMLNELGKSGTKVADTLKKKTGKSFRELMEGGSSLADVLSIVADSADEQGLAFGDLWSSAEAGKAALILLGDGADGFNETLGKMQDSTGATDEAFKKLDTNSYRLQKTLNQLKNDSIKMGRSIMDTLAPLLDRLSKKIQELHEWFNRLDEGQREMAVAAGIMVAALGPLLMIIGQITTGIGGLMRGISMLGPLLSVLSGPAGPILLMVAAFGWLINAMSDSRGVADEYREAVSELTPEEEKNRETIDSLCQSYQGLDSQRSAAVQSISAQAAQEQALFKELQGISDENGKVKAGYEERASFILGQLSEALQTEYTMTGNQIQNYKDMCASIDDLIMKKQANALLSANEAAYTEALMNQTEAYMSYNKAKKDVEDTTWAMLKAQEQEAYAAEQIRQLWQQNIETGTDVTDASAEWSRKQQEAAGAAQGLSEKLEGLNTDLLEAETAYVGFNTTIQNYEGLSTAIINGEQAGIEDAVLKITNNFQTSETATRESLQRQNDDLKAKYAEMKAAVEANAPGITQAQVDAMGRLVSESEKELSKLPAAGTKAGNDFGAGYSSGMREKAQEAISAGTELAAASVESLRESLDSHSPSNVTAGVGQDFDDGYAGGISKNQGVVRSAASEMADGSMAPLRDLPAKGRIWAADFMDGYISTMRGKIGELARACEEVAGTVSSYLHFTRPDIGPLREYEEWMPHMMEGLSEGIRRNRHLVTDQLIGLTRNMSTALTAAGDTRAQTTDLSKIEGLLGYYLPGMGGASIVLDDGTLVGKILPKVNAGLAADNGSRGRNG